MSINMNVPNITIASIERSLLNSVCPFWSLWRQCYGSFTVTYFQCSLVPIVVIGFSPYVAHLSIKYFSPYKPRTSLIIIIIKSLSENCKKKLLAPNNTDARKRLRYLRSEIPLNKSLRFRSKFQRRHSDTANARQIWDLTRGAEGNRSLCELRPTALCVS